MMMGGYGFYGNGGGSSSSASNLSPSATPFTVNRFSKLPGPGDVPNYSATFNPSLQNWVNPPSATGPSFLFDSDFEAAPLPFSNPTLSRPAFRPPDDGFLFNQSPVSHTEAVSYYPSYVPAFPGASAFDLFPTSNVETSSGSTINDYTKSFSGLDQSFLWTGPGKGSSDWKPREGPVFDGSSSVKDNYVNQGSYPPKGMYKSEEASLGSNMVVRENHMHSTGTTQFDGKSAAVENSKFFPGDYFIPASTPQSSSIFPEALTRMTPVSADNRKNEQVLYDASPETCSRKFSISSHDGMKCFPGVINRPTEQGVVNSSHSVVIKQSKPNEMATFTEKGNRDFGGSNSYAMEPPHPFTNSKGNHFDPTPLSFHLKQNDLSLMQVSLTEHEDPCIDEKVSEDTVGQALKGKHGTESPQINLVDLNILVDDGAVNVEHYSNSLEHYNPSVDSPCWKGHVVSHASPFGESDAFILQYAKSLEAPCGSNCRGAQTSHNLSSDGVAASPAKSCENPVHRDNVSLENDLDLGKDQKIAKVSFGEIGNAENFGSKNAKSRYGHMVQGLDPCKSSEDHLRPSTTNNSDIKPRFLGKKSLEEGKRKQESNCSSRIDTNIGILASDGVVDYSSDLMNEVEQMLCSASAEDASSQINASFDVESEQERHLKVASKQKMHVEVLINTIHNLSEMLLFHCSNETCKIKDEQYYLLGDVIENLHSCLNKKVEKTTSTQKPLSPQKDDSGFLKDVTKLQKGLSEHEGVSDEEHNAVVGEKGEKLLSSTSARATANIKQDNNMIQAIKKILDENFDDQEETDPQNLLYKNLWLEAEASLCSVNYMARFNRIKAEIGESSPHKRNAGKSPIFETKASSIVSSESSRGCTAVADDAKGVSLLDSSNINRSPDKEDIMARLRILQRHFNNASLSEDFLSSPEDSIDLTNDDKLGLELKAADSSVQVTPKAITGSHTDDVEASVLSRLRILKNRPDNSSPIKIEEEQTEKLYFECGCIESYFSKPKGVDVPPVNMDPVLQADAANPSTDKLTVHDLHPYEKGDLLGISGMDNKPSEMHAGTSSDWEHVLKEEFSVQGSSTLNSPTEY